MDDSYLTEIEYTGNFYHFLAPARLAYIAAINGYDPPDLSKPFTWCELGCGKGTTALILAATHPNGQFHACDFNPAHIDYAESLRRAAEIDNLVLHSKSFRDMLAEDLPPLDFIVLHGVYSWVPDAVRAEIHDFVRRRLAPGGLVMVSYNAMPGWAHLMPLRHMIRAYADAVPGTPAEKVRQAFARMEFLAKNGAAYFSTHPSAAEWLDEIADQDIRYVAHEYLTPHGTPFYFSEVTDAMGDVGLSFVGSTAPRNNYAELMAPVQFDDVLASAPNRTALEMQRDFIANTRFRRDVFAAQPCRHGAAGAASLAHLDAVAFSLTALPEQLPLESAAGTLTFDFRNERDAVTAIHALLASRPAGASDIHRAAGLRSEQETSVLIQKMVVAGHLDACPRAHSAAGWPKINSMLIDAALRERLSELPLACPATGAASNSEVLHAIAIEASLRHADSDAASQAVLTRLRELGTPILRQAEAGENVAVTANDACAYVAAIHRKLNETGSPARRLMRLYGLIPDDS